MLLESFRKLKRHFDIDIIDGLFDIDRRLILNIFFAIQMLYERNDARIEIKTMADCLIRILFSVHFALIFNKDTHTLSQERLISNIFKNLRPRIFDFREYLRICLKSYRRAGPVRLTYRFHRSFRFSLLEFLTPNLSLSFNRYASMKRQCIDDRYSDTVQSS